MARAHFVRKARKSYPSYGIKKGEGYYWWKFRFGSKHMSKTAPRRSQLTRSEYYGNIYDIEDEIAALNADDSLESAVEDIASRLRDIASEQEDKLSNMPDQLQYAPTGELLQQRADDCNSAADDLEGVDFGDVPEIDQDELKKLRGNARKDFLEEHEKEVEDYWQEKVEEVQGISIDIN